MTIYTLKAKVSHEAEAKVRPDLAIGCMYLRMFLDLSVLKFEDSIRNKRRLSRVEVTNICQNPETGRL